MTENKIDEVKTDEVKKPEEQLSLVDEAKAIRDDIVKAKEDLKVEREKFEKEKSEAILSGTGGRGLGTPQTEEEKAQEGAQKTADEIAGAFT